VGASKFLRILTFAELTGCGSACWQDLARSNVCRFEYILAFDEFFQFE
jgi:hypothetical protein